MNIINHKIVNYFGYFNNSFVLFLLFISTLLPNIPISSLHQLWYGSSSVPQILCQYNPSWSIFPNLVLANYEWSLWIHLLEFQFFSYFVKIIPLPYLDVCFCLMIFHSHFQISFFLKFLTDHLKSQLIY